MSINETSFDDKYLLNHSNQLATKNSNYTKAYNLFRDYLDNSRQNSFLKKINNWYIDQENQIPNSINAALSRKSINPNNQNNSYIEKTSLWKDTKKLFKTHVGSVLEKTKKDITSGNKYIVIGTILSTTAELWEGLSIFWNELAGKHPVLVPLNDFVMKPAAIALYSQILPEIGIIKACEFVGKAAKNYGETGKISKSIYDAACDTLTSTIRHFVRLTTGISIDFSVAKFLDNFVTNKRIVENLTKVIGDKDQIQALNELPSEILPYMGDYLNKALSGITDIDHSKIIKPILKSILSDNKINFNIDDFKPKFSKLHKDFPKKLESFLEKSNNNTLKNIIGLIKIEKSFTAIEKKKLISYIAEQTVQNAVRAVLNSEKKTDDNRGRSKNSFSDKYSSTKNSKLEKSSKESDISNSSHTKARSSTI